MNGEKSALILLPQQQRAKTSDGIFANHKFLPELPFVTF